VLGAVGPGPPAPGAAHQEDAVRARLGPTFGRLWQAAAWSNLADGIAMVGGALVAVQLTRSATLVAGVQIALTLPWLLLALHAGALADRYDRRDLLVWAAGIRALGFGFVGMLALGDLLTLPLLYAVLFVLGAGEVLFDTTSQSLVPSLVDRRRLEAANGRLVAVEVVANQFVGGPLAGVLVAASVAAVFLGPAALFAVAGLLLLGLPRGMRAVHPRGRSLQAEIREGLDELRRQPALRTLAILALLVNLAGAAFYAVFVLFVVGPGSAMGLSGVGFGLLMATMAAGSLVGTAIVEPLEERFGAARVLVGAMALTATGLLGPLLTTAVPPMAAVVFLVGVGTMLINVVVVSARQRIIADHLLGRVNAAYRLIGQGAMPVGALLGGIVGDLAGLRAVFLGGFAVMVAATLLAGRRLSDAALAAPQRAPATD
jgi:MFS family permease